MPEIVDARDVLDANARTKREMTVEVVGAFARLGPNAWDNYHFVAETQPPLRVLPGMPVQVEPQGTAFRLRKEGRVLRVRWVPGPGDPADLSEQPSSAQRDFFLRTYVMAFGEAQGMGAAAWIAGKLGE